MINRLLEQETAACHESEEGECGNGSCSVQLQLRKRDGASLEFFHHLSLHNSMDIYNNNKRVKIGASLVGCEKTILTSFSQDFVVVLNLAEQHRHRAAQ